MAEPQRESKTHQGTVEEAQQREAAAIQAQLDAIDKGQQAPQTLSQEGKTFTKKGY